MNAKQAAKAAAKKIEELEDYNRRCVRDIRAYNAVILTMIDGGSPCDLCEDHDECNRDVKGGKGCMEWWLTNNLPEAEEGGDGDDGEGILQASPAGGE